MCITNSSEGPVKKLPKILKPRNISGFADYTEAQNYMLAKWIKKIQHMYSLNGFTQLIPRPLELREVLLTKGGISKQIFGISRIQNDLPTDLALPFDRTVPLANWVAKHYSEIDFPYKRYDIGYSFRGERAQNGRFQGFFQADIDIIGRNKLSINADAECISVLYQAIKSLGIGNLYISLNNIQLVHAILNIYGVKNEEKPALLPIIDDIPKVDANVTEDRFSKLFFLEPKIVESLTNIFSYNGSIQEFKSITNCRIDDKIENLLGQLTTTGNSLTALGIQSNDIFFRPCIVRGLDYYTGTVFETFVCNHENFGSIASGGRYDDLASSYTKERLPGFGGSIGLTRLFDLACKNGLLKLERKTEAEIIVCYRDKDSIDKAFTIAALLRQNQIKTDVYSESDNLSKQLKYANNKGFENVIMVMDDNIYVLKEMKTGIQQEFNDIDFIIKYIKFNKHENSHFIKDGI